MHPVDGHADAQRLTLRYFLQELQHYLHLEKGLPRTFIDLLRRPAPMLRGYFDGTGRVGYTNPVAYSLMAAAASVLAHAMYRAPFEAWMQGQLRSVSAGVRTADYMAAYSGNLFAVSQHVALNAIALAVPQALLLRVLLRARGLNLAEAFAFALYCVGTYLFLHVLLVVPVLLATHGWDVARWVGLPLQMAVALRLGWRLFGGNAGAAVRVGVSALLSFVAWMLALALGVAVYTLVR